MSNTWRSSDALIGCWVSSAVASGAGEPGVRGGGAAAENEGREERDGEGSDVVEDFREGVLVEEVDGDESDSDESTASSYVITGVVVVGVLVDPSVVMSDNSECRVRVNVGLDMELRKDVNIGEELRGGRSPRGLLLLMVIDCEARECFC